MGKHVRTGLVGVVSTIWVNYLRHRKLIQWMDQLSWLPQIRGDLDKVMTFWVGFSVPTKLQVAQGLFEVSCYQLTTNTTRQDVLVIRKHLLKMLYNRRSKEHHKLLVKRDKLKNSIPSPLSSLGNYILRKVIAHKVAKAAKTMMRRS